MPYLPTQLALIGPWGYVPELLANRHRMRAPPVLGFVVLACLFSNVYAFPTSSVVKRCAA